jgi:predicted phage terminase large subunit-like protein
MGHLPNGTRLKKPKSIIDGLTRLYGPTPRTGITSAFNAGHLSSHEGLTLHRSIVRRNASGETGQPVYDLTVKDAHEFFANGVLVHNCTEGGGAESAGVLFAKDNDGRFYMEDVVTGQWSSHTRNKVMFQVAESDYQAYGSSVTTYTEQEPGSGGKESAEITVKQLAGYRVKIDRVTGDKEVRAAPLADQFEGGNVYIKRADWNRKVVEQFLSFPHTKLKDVVDASSGAFNKLVLVQRKVVGAVV